MNVFFLCNGSQSRFEGSGPKQLCEVEGEPLLVKMIGKVKKRGCDVRVFSHNEEIGDCVSSYGFPLTRLRPTDKLVETILATQPFWEDRLIFYLGDVYLTDNALNIVLKDKSDIRFFGTWYELFALTVAEYEHDRLYRNLINAKSFSPGKLWHLFRSVMGVPLSEHNITKFREHVAYKRIDDISDDVDTLKEYQRLLDNLKKEESG